MKKFWGNLRFIYVLCEVLLYSIKGWIMGFFTNRERYYWDHLYGSSARVLKNLKTTVEVQGMENMDPKKSYVLIGNHRSYTDILVLFYVMSGANRDVIFMSKKEIFRIPFLGKAMKSLGMIGVERGNSAKAMRSFLEASKAVKNGKNLIVFPEGTRSKDGKHMNPFKKGGFMIASRAGSSILPFAIEGTQDFMPRSGFGLYPAHVVLKILPEIDSHGKSDAEMMEQAESAIKSQLY